jgi:type III secretion protein C
MRDRGQSRIRLLVSIEDGSLSNQKVGAIPVVQRATLNTEALIVDGQSILLGGMVSSGTIDDRNKIPGAGDLPLVGRLFRDNRSATTRTERLFLITPRLAAVGSPIAAPGGAILPSPPAGGPQPRAIGPGGE